MTAQQLHSAVYGMPRLLPHPAAPTPWWVIGAIIAFYAMAAYFVSRMPK